MSFVSCVSSGKRILMEGALGERLKREYGLRLDPHVDLAGLVYERAGREALRGLWNEYADIAKAHELPFLATTPTRRSNRERVGASRFDSSIIRDNVELLREVQARGDLEMYVGGMVGCRGDAYTGEGALSLSEARDFHGWEAALFRQAGVDFLYAALMPTRDEAAGMALALQQVDIPYVISFTIRRDGCLVDGTPISEAIRFIDGLTDVPPVGYMTNCVHPRIAQEALSQPFNCCEVVARCFFGIQANTSPLSYAELDGSRELRSSDPVELADAMDGLRECVPIRIFGGCCGTDGSHMREIARRIAVPEAGR